MIECVAENTENKDNNGLESVYYSDFIWDICCFLYILQRWREEEEEEKKEDYIMFVSFSGLYWMCWLYTKLSFLFA